MDILYLLVPISILLVFLIGFIFWWALNNRQFDALDEAGRRILEDSESVKKNADKEPA
jgi:cbb3-type cytochrome oxidase maturation protein